MLVFMTTRTLSGLFLPMLFKMRFSLRPDGKILIHDGRARIRAQDTLQIDAEVTSVQFHPMMEHIFLSSDSRGRVCLRDTRMAFGPSSSRTKEGVVHSYHTYICRRSSSSLARLETSSVVFNSDGSQLCATNLHHHPIIYNLNDPYPVAVCSAPNLPDGTPVPVNERTYQNMCTMKHGSFGGPGLNTDSLYAAGSDDFRAYIWALPPSHELTERRRVMSYRDWTAEEHTGVTGK
ncbi:unnamed protein product [Mycena citricolor]|uniref:Uncharacterized protein n=1 Tax=Mycena citricolor TaxID=2018698 RepID=A0AAD2H6S1_9AGAR|nr:unnamed protein product [Mycena citricolor]